MIDITAVGEILIDLTQSGVNELGIPVKLIGVGEKIDDLQPFNSRDFVRALFENTGKNEQTENEESDDE